MKRGREGKGREGKREGRKREGGKVGRKGGREGSREGEPERGKTKQFKSHIRRTVELHFSQLVSENLGS